MVDALQDGGGLLLRQTPLWYYILKEAEVLHNGERLGPVGGRIVAEVFMRVLASSKDSIATDTNWKPKYGIDPADADNYKVVHLLRFARTFNVSPFG